MRVAALLFCSLLALDLFAEAADGAVAQTADNESPAKPGAPAFSIDAFLAGIPQRRVERTQKLPAAPRPPTAPDHPASHPIDAFITAKWPAGPAPELCDDATFLRRIHLDLLGVIPTAAEAAAFAAGTAPDKRTRTIDTLLQRHDEYAAHWIPFWEEALAGTPAGGNGLTARNVYSAWLTASFKANKPYDVMVAELLVGDLGPAEKKAGKELGENDPRAKEERAKAATAARPRGYVRNRTHADSLQTAANVGQVFLGTAIKCAMCHNHFDNPEWKLDTVTAFAGLFAAKDLELVRCESPRNTFVPARFLFTNMETPPLKPGDLSGRISFATTALVDPLNPRFARTIVNRLWKRYLGAGLIEPADDFRTDRPVSHPELLEWLAHDFLTHGCDLKHTIRRITTSRTYQLAVNAGLADTIDHAKPHAALFRSPQLRRLSAEQLIDSARMATQQKLDPAQRVCRMKDSTALTRALGRPPYVSAVSTVRSADIAVVQMLELMNGRELSEWIENAPLLKELPAVPAEDNRIQRLYMATLNRPARDGEQAAARELLTAGGTWHDLLWVLLCSPEFHYVK